MVFRDYQDLEARINRDDLEVDENSVLVLQNAGPLGGPGMPEWGMLPIPKKLLATRRARHGADLRRAHERHVLRHVRAARLAGELRRRPAGAGQDGDPITLDIPNRKLDLEVVPEEMERRRRAQWKRPVPQDRRGYLALYRERVTQAHLGCDFDFLSRDEGAGEPAIF